MRTYRTPEQALKMFLKEKCVICIHYDCKKQCYKEVNPDFVKDNEEINKFFEAVKKGNAAPISAEEIFEVTRVSFEIEEDLNS